MPYCQRDRFKENIVLFYSVSVFTQCQLLYEPLLLHDHRGAMVPTAVSAIVLSSISFWGKYFSFDIQVRQLVLILSTCSFLNSGEKWKTFFLTLGTICPTRTVEKDLET